MKVPLTIEQKRQLAGWLTREKDYLLSVRSMAQKIQIPAVTGSLDIICSDLEMTNRMRFTLRPDGEPDFQEEDLQTVLEIAGRNRFPDKEDFWNGIKTLLTPLV
ncbi:MAG: hypothetical protein QQN63_01810 [Nitrosopumilus sp.]